MVAALQEERESQAEAGGLNRAAEKLSNHFSDRYCACLNSRPEGESARAHARGCGSKEGRLAAHTGRKRTPIVASGNNGSARTHTHILNIPE